MRLETIQILGRIEWRDLDKVKLMKCSKVEGSKYEKFSMYKYQVVKWMQWDVGCEMVVDKAQFTYPIEEMSGGAKNAFFTLGVFRKGRARTGVRFVFTPRRLLRRA